MTTVTVTLMDGTTQTFTGASTLFVETQQYWLLIWDRDNKRIGGIPREQVKSFKTNLDVA